MAGARILLVGANQGTAPDLEMLLAGQGYSVCGAARTVAEALELAEVHPDLVLLDVRTAVDKAAPRPAEQLSARFSAPVVYLASTSDHEVLQHAGQLRPFDYVLEPPSARELHTVLQAALYAWHSDAASPEEDIRGGTSATGARSVEGSQQLEQEVVYWAQVEEALQQRSNELALLNRSAQALNATLDLEQVLATVLEEVRHLLNVATCSVWLVDPKTDELVGEQASGHGSDVVRGWRLPMGEGIAGWVARNGRSLVVPDTRVDGRHFRDIDLQARLELRSILSVPLVVNQKVIGVLQISDDQPGRFDMEDLMLLEPLAASASVAIENARLYQEAQKLREFNQNIVQSMEEGIFLTDRQGQITFSNRKAVELLGYDVEELNRQYWSALVAPEHSGQVQREMRRLAQGVVTKYETELLTRQQDRIPVLISACPVHEDGRFAGALVVFTDITERKQAEEVLRQQNEELAALNAISATISQVLDLDQILNATLRKVLDLTRMDAGWIYLVDWKAENGTLSLAAHRGVSEEMIQDIEGVKLGKGIMARVIRSRTPVVISGAPDEGRAGSARPRRKPSWTLATIPIQARDRVLGALSVMSHMPRELTPHNIQVLTAIGHQIGVAVENVHLLEEAADAQILRELDRLRSELIANVSHELRTPLGLIKVFATTLLREDVALDRQTQFDFLRDIERETDRLEEIVRNLLDLSRIEDGRLHLERTPTDLGLLAKEAMEEMKSQLSGHSLVHNFPLEPLIAPIDPKRLSQVLRNLLSNAVKYSPDGGTVTVRGRRERRHIVVEVSDQGIGIPEGDLERVFDRFYRVDNEVTRRVGGVGLGLAVCRGIVEAHGGRVWAESTLGEGSVFGFALPLGNAAQAGSGGS